MCGQPALIYTIGSCECYTTDIFMPISADGWNANVTPTSLRYELDSGASHAHAGTFLLR